MLSYYCCVIIPVVVLYEPAQGQTGQVSSVTATPMRQSTERLRSWKDGSTTEDQYEPPLMTTLLDVFRPPGGVCIPMRYLSDGYFGDTTFWLELVKLKFAAPPTRHKQSLYKHCHSKHEDQSQVYQALAMHSFGYLISHSLYYYTQRQSLKQSLQQQHENRPLTQDR